MRNRLLKLFSAPKSDNPLLDYFEDNREGPGIWKWRHYFEIYHRHFAKFVGRPVNVLEIGIHSGGSLGMWREYFGPKAQIIGVDIEPACRTYETHGVKTLIGDQGDPAFWASADLPELDVVIDDGGNRFEQQKVALESLWPKMRPGGVYICEDLRDNDQRFVNKIHSNAHRLHAAHYTENDSDNPERRLVCQRTAFQKKVHSIHQYPFVVVVEFNEEARGDELIAPKHGTSWEPALQ